MTCVAHFDTGMSEDPRVEIHSMQAFYQTVSAQCHKKKVVVLCASVITQTVHMDYVVVL